MYSAGAALWWALNEGVLQTLMIPLTMVMHDKLRHRSSEVTFSDRNDPIETLFLHRPHEPLRVGVGVSRQLHRRRAVGRKPFELPIRSIRYVAGSSS